MKQRFTMKQSPNATTRCTICEHASDTLVSERARARSNVRAFSSHLFEIWRCRACLSLHASDDVDLDRYYAEYPFHALTCDWRTRLLYDNQLRRLVRAGLRQDHWILDYGCGSGAFVRHLKSRGYSSVAGYDQYSAHHSDPGTLERNYDAIIVQDVIEHSTNPRALVSQLHQLAAPGALVAIGTPNAEAIDLSCTERYVHALHLPFHRHILSKRALLTLGHQWGWAIERYYPKQYANTRHPFLNASFYLYYMRLFDNSLDSLLEPLQLRPLLKHLPQAFFWGIFGYYLSQETDVMAVFRTPPRNGTS